MPYPGDWVGIQGLENCFAAFTETWSSLKLTEIRYFEGETGVAVSMRMQATSRRTGKHLDTQVGHFFIFEDGLIREFNIFYLDPVQVREVTLPQGCLSQVFGIVGDVGKATSRSLVATR